VITERATLGGFGLNQDTVLEAARRSVGTVMTWICEMVERR
jgi:hypothetical protein